MFKILRLSIYIATLQILSIILSSCATINIKNDLYYSIPTVSYLRECPAYDCPVVTELYSSDKIKLLAKNDTGWWYVQSLRDEKTGWTQPDLLSETPIVPKNYYVIVDQLPLRESPGEDIVSRKLLAYGDEVQKLAEKGDWWRVIAAKDKAIGWVPARMVSETPPVYLEKPPTTSEAAPGPVQPSKNNYYYVVSESVKLFLIPSNSSQVVKVLKLNDKVAKISQAGATWIKVRYLDTGAEGWAFARSFKDSPVTTKEEILSEKKKLPKKGSSSTQKTKESVTESIEPEGM